MKRTKKRFDFNRKSNVTNVVDCLECENYYTGACDAREGGCDAYTPTRKITMEKDIDTIKGLCISLNILAFSFAIAFIILSLGAVLAIL